MPTIPDDEFERQVNRTHEQFKTISELKEKLDILTEHVESRKEALEEEIQESLHEAIANAADSLERIQENIEPKVEKIIGEKLEEVDARANNWKNDFLYIVKQELEKESEPMAKKLAQNLDAIVLKNVAEMQEGMRFSLREDIHKGIREETETLKKDYLGKIETLRNQVYAALGLAVTAIIASAALYFIK